VTDREVDGARRGVDVTSLVAGIVITALGTLILLDQVDVLDLRFGYLWPALTATVGAILLASGLTRAR
jgi:hypothetical protein